MATTEDIMKALASCDDPELGINIVDLGLIYDVKLRHDEVVVTMTLTTPGCPLVLYFRQQIESAVRAASGLERVRIDLTFDPPWTPARMSAAGRDQLTLLRG